MKRTIRCTGLLLAAVVFCAGVSALLAPPASAASNCWRVDCNTCCRVGGHTICTQRACV